MIDKTFAEQERAEARTVEEAGAVPPGFKTWLEDRTEAIIADIEKERIKLSQRSWALSEALRAVRECRHRGTAPEAYDAALAALRVVVSAKWR